MWRWDQGRLLYFQFDTLKTIARTLMKYDGADVSICEAMFRNDLMNETAMPFAPAHYTIKRNYARMLQCSFLATFIENSLVVTDFCRELARNDGTIQSVDDYLFNVARKFRFPFPAFDDYDTASQRQYPFCTLMKLLIARLRNGADAKLSIDEVFTFIIANNCNGEEDIGYYQQLKAKNYSYSMTELRQVREMIIFISQLSILKFYDGMLYLDLITEAVAIDILKNTLIPENRPTSRNRAEEFLTMTSLTEQIVTPSFEVFTTDTIDSEFIEGKRKRVEHFRVERSPLLRKYYIDNNPEPICCACELHMLQKYPWADYLLDIHHLLPLSSAMRITPQGTSIEDIVGICPSCHRAIHMYYKKWLRLNSQDDFVSKEEARYVYYKAKKEIA